jgi:hypothetical protein
LILMGVRHPGNRGAAVPGSKRSHQRPSAMPATATLL